MCGGEQVAEKGDDLGGGKGVRAGLNRDNIFVHINIQDSKNLLLCIPVALIPYVLPFTTELLKVHCNALKVHSVELMFTNIPRDLLTSRALSCLFSLSVELDSVDQVLLRIFLPWFLGQNSLLAFISQTDPSQFPLESHLHLFLIPFPYTLCWFFRRFYFLDPFLILYILPNKVHPHVEFQLPSIW